MLNCCFPHKIHRLFPTFKDTTYKNCTRKITMKITNLTKLKESFQIYKKQNLIMPLLLTSKFVYYVKLLLWNWFIGWER